MTTMRIGAFGKPDSFSYLAARAAYKGITPISVPYTGDIFKELKNGKLDVAVVPLENTSGGWVEDVLFELMSLSTNDPTARVIKEIDLPIVLCVAGKSNKKTDLSSVKRIYSHPYPLVHSAEWLDKQHIKAERISTTSTSEAAEKAAKDPESVALCNSDAAKRAGLNILVDSIPAETQNMTRFLSISKENLSLVKNKNKSCLWFSAPNTPGALVKELEVFQKYAVNITRISSRSMDGFKTYRFFLEVDGDMASKKMEPVVKDLKSRTKEMAIIGSYPLLNVTLNRLSSISA